MKLCTFQNVDHFVCSFSCCRYECEESFTTLNVDIRNHQNLLDSMEQYVKGDLLEGANAYHCEKCNKKVRNSAPFWSLKTTGPPIVCKVFALTRLSCPCRSSFSFE